MPRWSPDGQEIAFIGGLMSDQGATGGDIYLISATGGAAKDLTPDSDQSAAWIHWLKPTQLLVSGIKAGQVEIGELDSVSGKISGSNLTIPASVGDGRLENSLSIG